MATPIPISQLPEITQLDETDLLLGVDLSQPVATQTGKFEAGSLLGLTSVTGVLVGSTQAVGGGVAVVANWAQSYANFMTVVPATGLMTVGQNGIYEMMATVVTDVGANNGWITFHARVDGGAWSQIGGAGTSDTNGCCTSSFAISLTAGQTVELGVDSSAAGNLTASSFTLKRIV